MDLVALREDHLDAFNLSVVPLLQQRDLWYGGEVFVVDGQLDGADGLRVMEADLLREGAELAVHDDEGVGAVEEWRAESVPASACA